MTAHDAHARLTLEADQLAWEETEEGGDGSDELVVAHVTGSAVLSLNGAAALLFRRLVDGATPQELALMLVDRYGIEPDRAAADTAALLNDLQVRGLLRSSE